MIDRYATAVHEAGHGVAHHHYGDRIRSLAVFDVAVDGMTGLTRVLPAGGRSPIASAICCLAGAAAEARLVGTGYASACKIDVKDAKAYLITTSLSVSDVWPETLKLIDHYRELIELVADTLIRSGELDGAQFHELVHPRGWRSSGASLLTSRRCAG